MKKTFKMTYDPDRIGIFDGNGKEFEIPECCGKLSSPIIGKLSIVWYCFSCQATLLNLDLSNADGLFLKMKILNQPPVAKPNE